MPWYLELSPEVVHGLGEVHVDAAVVDEHVVHLEEGVLGRLVAVEADESIVQRVAGLPVPDDVARRDLAEAGEYDLQIL